MSQVTFNDERIDFESPPSVWLRWLRRFSLISLVVFILYFVIFQSFAPWDWVDVEVGPLPANTHATWIVVETPSGMSPLDWYGSKVIAGSWPATFSYAPDFAKTSNGNWIVSVRWKVRERYGVLVQLKAVEPSHDRSYRVWWLQPHMIDPPTLMRFVGNGKAKMHLPEQSASQLVPSSTIKRLNLAVGLDKP